MPPDRTIARESYNGSKKVKTRLTLAFTANSTGTHKLQPLIIGNAAKPRAFSKKSGDQLGFYYRNNKKAWMTGDLFNEFLQKFNEDMKRLNKSALLLLDNAPSHIQPEFNFSNMKVLFFPPNCTAKIQPMDAGIIAAFKKRYRRFHLKNAVDR